MAVPLMSRRAADTCSGSSSSSLALPLAALLVFAIAAMMTKREVVYTYEDLAPHVKRIVERERVKAEIDAANRIQAALLPVDAPEVAGASVASHYRAATEIGGDYFDFLPHADRRDRHRVRRRLRPRPDQRHRHGHGQVRAAGAGRLRPVAARGDERAERHRHARPRRSGC